MKNMQLLFLIFSIIFLSSCAAHNKGYVEGPFAHYTHEVFTKEGTGETGLYVDGEDWYALIDLTGFNDVNIIRLASPNQFLFRKDKEDFYVSIFAEKIDGVSDSASCHNHISKHLEENIKLENVNIGEKQVLKNIATSPLGIKTIKQFLYCPYYKGHCFDFHISMDGKLDDNKVLNILNSIVFVDDETIKERVKKIFYVYNKKLQLMIPENCSHTFKSGSNLSSIIFRPKQGNGFTIWMSPLYSFKESSLDKSKTQAQKLIAKYKDNYKEEIILQETHKDGVNIFYFDFIDRKYKPNEPRDFPFVKAGIVSINGSVLYFTMYYREDGREDILKAFDALMNTKAIDIKDDPVIRLSN